MTSDEQESSSASIKMGQKPLPPVTVHFLGTCSGGGPITSRNCSSLAVDFGNEIWLFDCADGTLGRLHQSSLKTGNITRIFITHMHADHVLGLVWILTHIMSGIGASEESTEKIRKEGLSKKAGIHIYGPAGLRQLVRTNLTLTSASLSGAFAVHELLHPGTTPSATCKEEDLHTNEAVGMDIPADGNEVWENVLAEGNGRNGRGWAVRAGPITHRVPALGYILQEPTPRLPLDTARLIPLLQSNAAELAKFTPPVLHPLSLLSQLTSLPPPPPFTLPSGEILHPPEPSGVPPRKLVIFGDCSGGTKNPYFQGMCEDPSLLIHECTNSFIPDLIQRGEKGRKVRTTDLEPSLVEKSRNGYGKPGDQGPTDRDEDVEGRREREAKRKEEVKRKALGRGHSTPDEVGEFARNIRAKRVVVNHFSAMFPGPRYPSSDPFPSILSPVSPYPYPVPWSSLPYTLPPNPLSGGELHLRLILQSLASQINDLWNDRTQHQKQSEPGHPQERLERLSIPARDFMTLRIPAHELTTAEVDEMAAFGMEVKSIEEMWRRQGGVWVTDALEGGGKRWVGIDPAPSMDPI